MKRLPHIHRLQLHPHSEEVVSQISMVLQEETGKRNTQCVSAVHQGGVDTFENLFEMCPCGFCHFADYQIDFQLQLGAPGPMFFSSQHNPRKRGDSLTTRGQICRTKPIISKAPCASISSAASNVNLTNTEIALTKMRIYLRNGYLKISSGQSIMRQPLPPESNQRSRGTRTQPEVPKGNAQHGWMQPRVALIYPNGCPAPAGHQNKDLGWFPRAARWEGLFSSQETKGGPPRNELGPKMRAMRERDGGKTCNYVQGHAHNNTFTQDQTWLHPEGCTQQLWGCSPETQKQPRFSPDLPPV